MINPRITPLLIIVGILAVYDIEIPFLKSYTDHVIKEAQEVCFFGKKAKNIDKNFFFYKKIFSVLHAVDQN
jgi:hypothetical protein